MPAAVATAFFNVNCHEGFHCVSKVDVFGRYHDGTYLGKPIGQAISQRYNGAYEWGCPARGEMTDAGECANTGKGPVAFCYSNSRFEAGPQAPCKDDMMCMCIKDGSEGTGGTAHQAHQTPNQSNEAEAGAELRTEEFVTQPMAVCEDCSVHTCDMGACNACANCEWATKTLNGRTAKGCYFVDSGLAMNERTHSREGRAYLFDGIKGPSSKEKLEKLAVIPHYPIWDPGSIRPEDEWGGDAGHVAKVLAQPWQSRAEPLEKDAWLHVYTEAAPRIQRLLDLTADNLKEWAPKAKDLLCTTDPTTRVEKFLAMQRKCREMQETAYKLLPNSPFPSRVPNGKGGFDDVNCQKGKGGVCEVLNCYTSNDPDVTKAVDLMQFRSKTCRKAIQYLEKEEAKNGPATQEAQVSALSGGRLEGKLPKPRKPGQPPPTGTEAASPLPAALAALAAAGAAVTTAQAVVVPTLAEDQALRGPYSRELRGQGACRPAARSKRRGAPFL